MVTGMVKKAGVVQSWAPVADRSARTGGGWRGPALLPALLLGAGLAFALPGWAADAAVQQMPAYRIKASPLGLIGLTMSLDIAGSSSDPAQQLLRSLVVQKVLAGSPADRAGMHRKDTILTIDGHAIPGMSRADLQELLGAKNIGDAIVFEVVGSKPPVKRSIALTVGAGAPAPQ